MLRVHRIPVGLCVLDGGESEPPLLIVKGIKEAILAARIRRGFAVYIVPVHVDGVESVSLITAFFDDPDEPLVVRSPLFANDPHSLSLMDFLLSSEGQVHFFDEHSREMLAYGCRIGVPASTRKLLETANLVEYGHGKWRGIDDQAQEWFSVRTTAHDAGAIRVELLEPLMPEDIAYIDGTPGNTSYLGSDAVTTTSLVRTQPGPFQEHDIALLLQRLFDSTQVIRGPLRTNDKEEVADFIVVTPDTLLIIQAKDSPNTEQILAKSIEKKKAATLRHLKKALGQIRGAIGYARREPLLRMIVEGKEVALDVSGKRWLALAVVKELFNNEYETYSPMILEVAKATSVPCIAIDYVELNMYTANLGDEKAFVAAFDRVFEFGERTGMLPRLRIGPGDVQDFNSQ